MSEPPISEGLVDPEVAAELPGLRLFETTIPEGTGPSLPGVVERLRHLAGRLTGAEAVAARTRPIPQAYRRLFRHIGLDPDEQRVPLEAAILRRLEQGDYTPADRLDDALTVAVVETAVPLWALDDGLLSGPLRLRPARRGERLGTGRAHARGSDVDEVPAGRLVVADDTGPVAVLFGRLAPSHVVTRRTTAARLFSVQAPGVPEIHVSEAFWTCISCLREDDSGVH